MTSRWKNTEGNAAVEFGLVLPLLLIILLGIIDWGHVHFTRMTMTNAAREGARAGVVDAADPEGTGIAAAQTYLQGTIPNATVNADSGPDDDDDVIRINVELDFQPLIGFVPTPSHLRASAAMRWEMAEITQSP